MKSSSYFEERSELRMKKMHDKATKCMTKVNKAYDDSLERLKKEIDHIMSDYSPTEKIDYDKYKELLQIYNTTKDTRVKAEAKRLIKENSASYRIQRKEALSKAIEIEKLKQVDTQLNLGGKHLKNVYSSVLSDLGGARVSEKYLDEVLNHNWAGSNFSKRVWHNQDVLAKSLESNLLQSFASGKSNKQIADELEYHTNLGRYAANRLIRTETSYMVNSADLESSKQRGIKAKKFQANLDKRTSKICREHNQKVILIDDIKIGENAPPLHPFCRSFLSDVLEGWGGNGQIHVKAEVIKNNSNKLIKTIEEEAELYADYKLKHINKIEPEITKFLKDVSDSENSELFGLDYRIKTKESLIRKIISDSKEKAIPIKETTNQINDILRYTMINDDESFTYKYFKIIEKMKEKGYNTIRVKNTFVDGVTYKGINTLVQTKSGDIFELQFHTPESIKVKEDDLHKIYEKQRLLNKNKDKKKWDSLTEEMIQISNTIPIPKNVERIK